jgi:hypothetical protein
MPLLTIPGRAEKPGHELRPSGEVRIVPVQKSQPGTQDIVFFLAISNAPCGGDLRYTVKNRENVPRKLPELPAEVIAFCESLGILGYATIASELVNKHLVPENVTMQVSYDPEGDAEWLVLRANVRGSVAKVLQAYSACKREWLTVAPEPVRGLVRFLYNIV